jgi:hypothetical protein
VKICYKCNRKFSSVFPENNICRECLSLELKEKEVSRLPKHEKPKIPALELKDIWLIPDKEKK